MLIIIALLLPYLLEVTIETYYEKQKRISLNHPVTALIRGALMLIISLVFWRLGITESWWQGAFLSGTIHFAFFNYTYNLITGRKLFYLRDAGIDKLLKSLPVQAILFLQAFLLFAGILLFIDYWNFY